MIKGCHTQVDYAGTRINGFHNPGRKLSWRCTRKASARQKRFHEDRTNNEGAVWADRGRPCAPAGYEDSCDESPMHAFYAVEVGTLASARHNFTDARVGEVRML